VPPSMFSHIHILLRVVRQVSLTHHQYVAEKRFASEYVL